MEQKPLNTVHGGLRFRWDPQSHSHKKRNEALHFILV